MYPIQDVTDIEYLVSGSEIKFKLFLYDIDGDVSKSSFEILVYTESREKGVRLNDNDLARIEDKVFVVIADSTNMGLGKVKAVIYLDVYDDEVIGNHRRLIKQLETNLIVIP